MVVRSGKLAECRRQGDLISESSIFRQSVNVIDSSTSGLIGLSSDIIRYNGSKSCPEWLDIESGRYPRRTVWSCPSLSLSDMYEIECSVTANTEATAKNLPMKFRADGAAYYDLSYVIELSFGLTEYEACIRWQENVSHPFDHLSDDIEPFTG